MSKVAHVIGNGDMAQMYKPAKGIKVTCNIPPFQVNNVFATAIVDFKMCAAIKEGSVTVPGDWVAGFRPQMWCQKYPDFYMKYAPQIKEFYTVLPKYAIFKGQTSGQGYTNFNCGHMATHWVANKLKATEIHLYGFDSIFDFTLRSYTDLVLNSDRGNTNNNRLINNWRPIWNGIFAEFKNTQFVLYHRHAEAKIPLPKNVEVRTKN